RGTGCRPIQDRCRAGRSRPPLPGTRSWTCRGPDRPAGVLAVHQSSAQSVGSVPHCSCDRPAVPAVSADSGAPGAGCVIPARLLLAEPADSPKNGQAARSLRPGLVRAGTTGCPGHLTGPVRFGSMSSRSPLILIVSDRLWSFRSLESILAPNGFSVIAAGSAEKAVE